MGTPDGTIVENKPPLPRDFFLFLFFIFRSFFYLFFILNMFFLYLSSIILAIQIASSESWSQYQRPSSGEDGSWVEQRPIGGYWTEEDAANDGPPPGTVLTEEQKEILKQNPNVKPTRCPWSQSCANPNREAWAREACCYGRTLGFGKEVNRQDIPIPKVVPRRCTWENSCNNRKRDPWASCCYGKAHSLKSQKSRLLRRLAAR